MELQLGLALAPNGSENFDLNSTGYDSKEGSPHTHGHQSYNSNKRSFDEAFDVPQTLSLFFRDRHNPMDKVDLDEINSSSINKLLSDGEEDGKVIGWPPIKSCRKIKVSPSVNYMHNNKYVKVKMEGVGIARKVDLSQHHSYQTLTRTLLSMFDKYQEDHKQAAYKLTYQDKEGDWLLAGDLPWGSFMRSVQRLKLIKKNCS